MSLLGPQTQFRLNNPGKVKLTVSEEEDFASQQLFQKVSPETAIKLITGPPPQDWPEGRHPQYFMVEDPDGEWSTLKMFRNEEGMLRRLRELDGQDVTVWLAYGIQIPFSKKVAGDVRTVFMPNDTARRLDPKFTRVDELDVAVTMQDDGYLGPDELQIVSHRPETDSPSPARRSRKPPPPPADPGGTGSFDEDETGGDPDEFES
jgi:hypothetical protein